MAKKIWISSYRGANYQRFILQKSLVQKHFPCFKCSFSNRHWHCVAKMVPCEDCDTYRITIDYKYGGIPVVRVTEPAIEPCADIHMYRDRSLCLYFPKDDPWKLSDNLHEKIIPWIAEWLVFYELYLLTGKWLGPEAPHAITERRVEDRRAQSQAEHSDFISDCLPS